MFFGRSGYLLEVSIAEYKGEQLYYHITAVLGAITRI